MAIRVVTRDGSVDVWGADEGAAYEIARDGCLRIVVFEPGANGLRHAREVALCTDGDWTDVRSDDPPLHPGQSPR